jgi:hypothetical protein
VTAVTFITYLWHYVVARLIYDGLIRGHGAPLVVLVLVGALVLVRRRRRRAK